MAFANNPKIVRCADGGVPEVTDEHGEAATQSFLKGQLVYLGTDGLLTECESDTVLVFGRVLEDATGTTSTARQVEIIKPGDKIKMKLTNGGTATTSASYEHGVAYGFYEASNIIYADLADNDNDAVVFLHGVEDKDGTEVAWGIFQVLDGICQIGIGVGT